MTRRKALAALKAALKLLSDSGLEAKYIAHRVGVSYHRVLRSNPEKFATARRSTATP